MPKSNKHDVTDSLIDENEIVDAEFEAGADTDEVQDAEDAAVNIDNETAVPRESVYRDDVRPANPPPPGSRPQ